MKKIRTLFIGLLIGGGIGIAFGMQIGSILGKSATWFPIELGLKTGASLGLIIAGIGILAEEKNSRSKSF